MGWGLGLQAGIKVLILRSGPGSAEQSRCYSGCRGCLPPCSSASEMKAPTANSESSGAISLHIFTRKETLFGMIYQHIIN